MAGNIGIEYTSALTCVSRFHPPCFYSLRFYPSRFHSSRLTYCCVNAREVNVNARAEENSFITDATGTAIQHLEYLPYGELWVNQQSGSFDSRYTFSAKEKDDETQYSYFGARYYDSDLSVWLSVDPMSDKRSWISPYNYCQWNPVGRVDPTGALDGLPDNYHIYESGDQNNNKVTVEKTNDPTNTYYYHKGNGEVVNMGTYDKSKNGDKVNLSNSDYIIFNNPTTMEKTPWINADAAAGLFGALMQYRQESCDNDYKLETTQLQGEFGFHTDKNYASAMADIRYVSNQGNKNNANGKTNPGFTVADSEFDYYKSWTLSAAFKDWGFSDILTAKSASSNVPALPGTRGFPKHHDHMHLQGFHLNVGVYTP